MGLLPKEYVDRDPLSLLSTPKDDEKPIYVPAGPNIVTDRELRDMALELIDQQKVIEVLIHHHFSPNDTTGRDISKFSKVKRDLYFVMGALPSTDLNPQMTSLFLEYDSKYHQKGYNNLVVYYHGVSSPEDYHPCTGSEVNYYFEGNLFRIFGFSKSFMHEAIFGWKKAMHHGAVTENVQLFADKGWSELPEIWQEALASKRAEIHRLKNILLKANIPRGRQALIDKLLDEPYL